MRERSGSSVDPARLQRTTSLRRSSRFPWGSPWTKPETVTVHRPKTVPDLSLERLADQFSPGFLLLFGQNLHHQIHPVSSRLLTKTSGAALPRRRRPTRITAGGANLPLLFRSQLQCLD